jgi:hypothetical protein
MSVFYLTLIFFSQRIKSELCSPHIPSSCRSLSSVALVDPFLLYKPNTNDHAPNFYDEAIHELSNCRYFFGFHGFFGAIIPQEWLSGEESYQFDRGSRLL